MERGSKIFQRFLKVFLTSIQKFLVFVVKSKRDKQNPIIVQIKNQSHMFFRTSIEQRFQEGELYTERE